MLLKDSNETLKLIIIKELILIEEIKILGNIINKMSELKLFLKILASLDIISSLKSLFKLIKHIFAGILIKHKILSLNRLNILPNNVHFNII